ncbi:MAG: hypothetical protein AAF915_03680 [Cyanobacteria bacterium P01_D01_bin.50]
MNAIQSTREELQPIQQRRTIPRPKRHLRQRSYEVMALETTVKIGVNLAISAVAISALTQLLPHHWSGQEKLRQMRTEVKIARERVNKLRSEFSNTFDSRQASNIMQQQGNRIPSSKKRIILTNNTTPAEIREFKP